MITVADWLVAVLGRFGWLERVKEVEREQWKETVLIMRAHYWACYRLYSTALHGQSHLSARVASSKLLHVFMKEQLLCIYEGATALLLPGRDLGQYYHNKVQFMSKLMSVAKLE